MNRKHIILIVIGFVVVATAVVALLPDGQPGYQGRTLTAWIDAMQQSGPGAPDWLAASNAIHNIGTNAVPILMRWETSHDSKARAVIVSKWNAHAAYEWRLRSDEERRMMAWFAFGALGDKSSPAWPVFIQWTQDKDKGMRRRGITMLRGCRADKAVFVPVAQRLLKDPEPEVQLVTALYFRDLYPAEAEAVGVYRQFPDIKSAPAQTTTTSRPSSK